MKSLTIDKYINNTDTQQIANLSLDTYCAHIINAELNNGSKIKITIGYAAIKIEMPEESMCISGIKEDSIVIGHDKV